MDETENCFVGKFLWCRENILKTKIKSHLIDDYKSKWLNHLILIGNNRLQNVLFGTKKREVCLGYHHIVCESTWIVLFSRDSTVLEGPWPPHI
jgi:hypothetical protein